MQSSSNKNSDWCTRRFRSKQVPGVSGPRTPLSQNSIVALPSHWITSDEEPALTLCYAGDQVILESQATSKAFKWAYRVLKMHRSYNNFK